MIRLSDLRRIGWTEWDPMGLADGGVAPDQAQDEYDTYLLEAVAMLQRGVARNEITGYLEAIEREHIGLDEAHDTHGRVSRTVVALEAMIASQLP